MLKEWGVDEEHLENFQPCLQYSKEIKSSHYKDLPDKYFVVHVGTGAEAREWETTSWRVLALKLDALGYPLVFIGKGQRERGKIELAIKGLNNALNFCDKFSWKELIPVIKNAKFLIGLESMAGHMAAAYSIPALLIYAGESFVNWRPYHPYCQTIKPPEKYWFELEKIHPKMPIHMISPEEVFEKAQKILKAHRLL